MQIILPICANKKIPPYCRNDFFFKITIFLDNYKKYSAIKNKNNYLKCLHYDNC